MALAGDVASDERWRILVEQRPRLLRLLLRRGMAPADAEDCVQETLLRAALMARVDGETVQGLVTTIAVHLATDVHRRDARATRLRPRLLPGASALPDEVAVDRILARSAAESARSLSRTERTVLSHIADGFRPREIATRLGVPAKTVHLALHRARKSLRVAGGGLAILAGLRRVLSRGARQLAPATLGLTAMTLLLSAPGATLNPSPLRPFDQAPTVHVRAGYAPGSVPSHSAPSAAMPRISPSAAAPRGAVLPPPAPQTKVWLGAPGVGGGPVTVTRTHGDRSFVDSVVACLAPGAISLDPKNAGCSG